MPASVAASCNRVGSRYRRAAVDKNVVDLAIGVGLVDFSYAVAVDTCDAHKAIRRHIGSSIVVDRYPPIGLF